MTVISSWFFRHLSTDSYLARWLSATCHQIWNVSIKWGTIIESPNNNFIRTVFYWCTIFLHECDLHVHNKWWPCITFCGNLWFSEPVNQIEPWFQRAKIIINRTICYYNIKFQMLSYHQDLCCQCLLHYSEPFHELTIIIDEGLVNLSSSAADF